MALSRRCSRSPSGSPARERDPPGPRGATAYGTRQAFPAQAALKHVNVMFEEMTVEATLGEIQQMVNEMLETNRDHLPQFREFEG